MTVYSRELSRMIYFEAYGYNPARYGKSVYSATRGLVLSSLRPVEVLIPEPMYQQLRRTRVKKYTVLRSSSNQRIVLRTRDIVINIYDEYRLRRYTGKSATVPQRIAMRLKTLKRMSDTMFTTRWEDVITYMGEGGELLLLALYYNYRRGSLGMKLFVFDNPFVVEVFFSKVGYREGVLAIHDNAVVYVPIPYSHVRYNDLRRAFESIRTARMRGRRRGLRTTIQPGH
ncbi:hypothetical protein PYJP_13830 [Pyrofollis japonicus]|uniref:hypothetical protein n=1 Tax=Pyrofollis japonicus TaxID=3060460 RepID=UPI00295BEAF2|nr:hypothetical protein [Pyrofollis japonicus]BEP18031.1 hypothetical protein PYJP_13830 [Pyrofollis japonicus]